MEKLEWACRLAGALILAIAALGDIKSKKISVLCPVILGFLGMALRCIPLIVYILTGEVCILSGDKNALLGGKYILSGEIGGGSLENACDVWPMLLAGILDGAVGMVPGILVLLVRVAASGQIGFGDGILLISVSGILGGIESIEAFMLSLFLVSVFSLGGLILKKLSRKSKLPFVPFYFAAYMGVVYL